MRCSFVGDLLVVVDCCLLCIICSVLFVVCSVRCLLVVVCVNLV